MVVAEGSSLGSKNAVTCLNSRAPDETGIDCSVMLKIIKLGSRSACLGRTPGAVRSSSCLCSGENSAVHSGLCAAGPGCSLRAAPCELLRCAVSVLWVTQRGAEPSPELPRQARRGGEPWGSHKQRFGMFLSPHIS